MEEKELPISDILSYSRIDTFKTCPMRYKIRYVDKNYDDATSLALSLGTLSHYIFELKHTPGQTMTLEEIWQGFMDGFEEEGIKGWNDLVDEYGFEIYEIDEKTGNSVEDRVQIMKDKFFNETIEDEWEVIGLEKEFIITFNNKAKIKGFIDRVDRNKITGEIRVIDLKTNKKPYDSKQLATPLQMYIYSLACYELYGQYPSECIYDMLFLDMKQVGGTKGYMARGFTALNKLLDQIIWYQEIGAEHMPPNQSPLCHFCPFCKTNPNSDPFYNTLCEYYSNWTRQNKTFSVNKKWIPPQTTSDEDDDFDALWG